MTHPIPSAALDDRLAFLGIGGSGKTYNAGGAVERLLDHKARVCIIDPLGAWYGLRLSADGKQESAYKIVIFGGPHGDLPLTENSGALIGETVASMSESCILDLSEIGTDAGERRFMLAFLTALYKNHSKSLLHLIVDEADMWAPQQIFDKDGEAAKLVGKMQTIVRRGRIRGFIPWLITQRPAVLSWGVLSQIVGIVAFTLTSSQDRDAIGRWVTGQADKDRWNEIWAQLPELPVGDGLVWIPRRKVFGIKAFPQKKTFDSSRAPKRGESRKTRTLKPLNLDKIKGQLANIEIEAVANDPKKLRSEIATLKAERDKLAKAKTAADPEALKKAEERGADRAAKVLSSDPTVKKLRAALEIAMKFIVEINAKGFFKAGGPAIDQKAVEKAIADATQHITRMIEKHLENRDKQLGSLRSQGARVITQLKKLIDQDVTVKVDVRHNQPFTIAESSKASPKALPRAAALAGGDGSLTNPQRALLRSMAWWKSMGHDSPTRTQIAAIAKWKPKGSNLRNRLTELSSAGLIEYCSNGSVQMTEAGAAAAPEPDTSANVIDSIRAVCSGPMLAVFDAILAFRAEGVEEVERQALAERLTWEPGGSNLRNRLTELSSIEAVGYPGKGSVALQDWVKEAA